MSVWDDPEMRIASDYAKFENVGDTVSGTVTGVYAHRFDDGKVVPKIMLDTEDGEGLEAVDDVGHRESVDEAVVTPAQTMDCDASGESERD